MATFGNTGAGTQANFFLEGTTFGSLFTLTENGSLSMMTLRVDSMAANTTGVTGRVYADTAGTPGALLGSTTSRTLTTSDTGLQDFTFAAPLDLSAGSYWLCFSSTGGNNFAARSDSVADLTKIQAASAPDPFAPTVNSEGPSIIYATYTVLAAAAQLRNAMTSRGVSW